MSPAPTHARRVEGFIHFSSDDYRAAAQACRAAAALAAQDAEKQNNPSVIRMFNDSARRYRDLAEKLELAARVR